MLKVAELLKVKGLVEEEREKLLGHSKDPSARVSVTTNEDARDGPASPKVNGKAGDSKANDGPNSPPSSSSAGGPARPFLYTPPAGGAQFPMWPLPGIFPGAAAAQHLFNG